MDIPAAWLSITGEPLDLNTQESFLAYGVVTRSLDTRTSAVVAIKQLHISSSERHNGIPITTLREISILRSLRHRNIVNVLDVAVGEDKLEDVFMVMEYCEQVGTLVYSRWLMLASALEVEVVRAGVMQDMASLMDELKVKFTLSQVKCLARQLLEGLEYIHRNDIIHRDVKLQNLLLTAKGVLKLADFGLSRRYSARPLTPGVVTIWYRAPEILLGTAHYTPSIDLWSAGLIISELLLNEPVLPAETPIAQLAAIVKLLGTPTKEDVEALRELGCPGLVRWQRDGMPSGRADNLARRFEGVATEGTLKFLKGLLRWDMRERWTATEALGRSRRPPRNAEHWWTESPRAVEKEMLPTFLEVRNAAGGSSGKRKLEVPERVKEGKKHGVDEGAGKEFGGYAFDFGGGDGDGDGAGVVKGVKRVMR
ncbi:Pkinase-domain-containing protein [Mytilinidion resinicola]|uniref:cyclin-dependent kinase n=1 Tax=Mytilinidion resinicola TaxID=574789 RepID=A0A6A6YU64_9PEZI|nr:Pkinase-domain-containing protein [Mytilinidion resinicola]KAF2812069.1 Pkinase-domain-containing protein [Mytilinidion resinicola]